MSMFAMPQHHYGYGTPPAAAAPQTRHYSTHGTSSAFSSSAHPDEDWTKISDLAERRRIQNRIAQRNYRKKLKRRLEDLERIAGSSDEADLEKKRTPSPSKGNAKSRAASSAASAVTSTTAKAQKPRPRPQTRPQQAPAPTKLLSQGQFTPPMEHTDEPVFTSPLYGDRDRSHTPPPVFSYGSYPAPDELLLDPYGSAQPYPTMSTAADPYPSYLTSSITAGLPPMTPFGTSNTIKRESFPSDDGLSPYLHYGFVSGVDMNMPSPYDAPNPHTPPLSHSFDHSASCSETGYEYPTTPLSMPGSPGLIQH